MSEKSVTPLCPHAAPICDGETFEPLDGEYGILQHRDRYRFGGDAVWLSRFAGRFIKNGESVFDLCSGCGIVGITLAIERGATVCGAEIDEALCDMSVRSCALNGLCGVTFYNADIRDVSNAAFTPRAFDAVVCNPPFFKATSKSRAVAPAANSELTATLSDVVRAAKYLLKPSGEFFIVHTATRLDEVVCECVSNKLMPKNLVINENGKTFLLRAVLGGKRGMSVEISR